MKLKGGIDWVGPTPEPVWQEELDRICPRSDRLSWLLLRWEPGEAWEPVERWVIWQMRSVHLTSQYVRDDLFGPSPRERGFYDRVLDRFVADPRCNVSYQQWLLYRETGYFGRPFWVLQGSRGGHKRDWDRVESVVSRMNGGPKEPPDMGDLPYAVPDSRTYAMLGELDRVRAWKYTIDFATKNAAAMDAETEDAKKHLESLVWGWLDRQIESVSNETAYHMKDLEVNPLAKHRAVAA